VSLSLFLSLSLSLAVCVHTYACVCACELISFIESAKELGVSNVISATLHAQFFVSV